MILTRTPFRITLGGGGTDLPAFYEKHGGYVLAMGIDKYMYVALNVPYADRKVRLHYSKSESVDHVNHLEHELAREALKLHGIFDAIEVSSLADLPAGTGLGSSSCYLVGLLNAIRAYRMKPVGAEELADEACRIELETLAKPIGKQDQYMAASGGLSELIISKDGKVVVRRIAIPGYALTDFVSKTHLYYLNVQRSTTTILSEQSDSLRAAPADNAKPGAGAVEASLLEIKEIGYKIADAFRACDFDTFGSLMHDHWMAKKRLSGKVTVPIVEQLYDRVRADYGVLGGKVAGAGGGGFLMLYCPKDGARLTDYMSSLGMTRMPFNAEYEGSKVIANVMSGRSIDYHSSDLLPNVDRLTKSAQSTFI